MALRPLASKVWWATKSRRDTSSKARTNQLSGLASFAGAGTNRSQCRATEAEGWDHSGSEIGLNTLQPGEIVKTNRVSISSERQSKDGTGYVMEDGTCKGWKENPRDGFTDAA